MYFKRLTRKAGFTLAEFMIALGIGALILTALMALSLFSGQSFAALANYMALNQKSQQALDRLTKDIRQANRVISWSTNAISLDHPSGVLSYIYYPTNYSVASQQGMFVRSQGGVSENLLTHCHELEFAMFQRNSPPNSFNQYTTTNPDACKEIQVKWTCRRSIIGNFRNSESVQTARVVIRKQ